MISPVWLCFGVSATDSLSGSPQRLAEMVFYGVAGTTGFIASCCMTCAPRLEIDLDKIYHNAHTLVQRLIGRGTSVIGVTKATLGSVDIANVAASRGNFRVSEGKFCFKRLVFE